MTGVSLLAVGGLCTAIPGSSGGSGGSCDPGQRETELNRTVREMEIIIILDVNKPRRYMQATIARLIPQIAPYDPALAVYSHTNPLVVAYRLQECSTV